MSKMNIDIYYRDKKYQNKTLDTVEGIYEILWMYDYIINDAEKGNIEAILLLDEIDQLIRDIKDEEYAIILRKYIAIKIEGIFVTKEDAKGTSNAGSGEFGDEINSLSQILGITYGCCEKKFEEALCELARLSKENNIICGERVANKNCSIEKNDQSKLNKNINSNIKNCDNKKDTISELSCGPKDLSFLISLQDKNKERIKNLTLIKDKTHKESEELNKRIKLNKELQEDINLLKDHYNIYHNMRKNFECRTIEKIDFTEAYELERSLESYEEEENNKIQKQWQVAWINKVAKEVLTDKQLLIFNLYYFNDLTQQEVAEVISASREYVKNEIIKIKKKIIKRL